jgi:hypothetical protein
MIRKSMKREKPMPESRQEIEDSPENKFVKSYTLTPKALEIVMQESQRNRFGVSAFVSTCIEEYGPALLDEKSENADKNPTLSARLEYLEEWVVAWAYLEVIKEWKKSKTTAQAHRQILKKAKTMSWHDVEKINKILKLAKKNAKTKDTTQGEWQTLVRCIDKLSSVDD